MVTRCSDYRIKKKKHLLKIIRFLLIQYKQEKTVQPKDKQKRVNLLHMLHLQL